jgi:hypothetical protein
MSTIIGGTKKAPIGHMDPYRRSSYGDVFCPTDDVLIKRVALFIWGNRLLSWGRGEN